MISARTAASLVALVMAAAAAPVSADGSCIDFKWDVSRERALFEGTSISMQAGVDAADAPAVEPNRLYRLQLSAQDKVAFAVIPGRKMPTPGAHAGLAKLKIPATGTYRVALDLPVWIDVVANGALIKASDFQGQHDCDAPHKIVEFELTGGQQIVLQLSEASLDAVRMAITAAPARKL